MALLMMLRRMGRDDLTAHGFRSTFRDWAAECSGVAPEVAEAALAHTVLFELLLRKVPQVALREMGLAFLKRGILVH
jgi:hypothetical protein